MSKQIENCQTYQVNYFLRSYERYGMNHATSKSSIEEMQAQPTLHPKPECGVN